MVLIISSMVAIPLSNTVLPFTIPCQNLDFHSTTKFAAPFLGQKFQLGELSHIATKPPTLICKVLYKTGDSLSSILSEVKEDKTQSRLEQNDQEESQITTIGQPEHNLIDALCEILGQDDWAGLLNPMDRLFRS